MSASRVVRASRKALIVCKKLHSKAAKFYKSKEAILRIILTKRNLALVFAAFILQGYVIAQTVWTNSPSSVQAFQIATETPSPIPTNTSDFPPVASTLVVVPSPSDEALQRIGWPLKPSATPSTDSVARQQETSAINGIERVVIVSFDGMRPDAIEAAGMTNLLELMKTSAYSLSARTISYPTTLPSHTSMLSGMCMEKHGMKWNGNNLYRGYAKGTDLFNLTHEAGMKSIMLVGKEKLRLIAEPETTDVFEVFWGEALIAQAAIKLIPNDFDLMFLHFPSADLIGHKHGWMSNAQFKALRDGDDALGAVLAALDENGMRESTLVIVTADHGGHNKTHDGSRIEDYLIPWIISGPGVVPMQLTSPIYTMDTAATVDYALGFSRQPQWDGLAVYEAFGLPMQDVHYTKNVCR